MFQEFFTCIVRTEILTEMLLLVDLVSQPSSKKIILTYKI